MTKVVKRELKTDEELSKDGKNRDFERKQKISDSLTLVIQISIYAIPLTILVVFAILSIHNYKTGNWGWFEFILNSIISWAIGLATHYLISIGLKVDEKS